ncbi:MAG: bifunctional (p)ppGpp synthetase/guanosine-3',5'-bis(diphosphate) 3'-pyrophosphohydrolase [Alistipes sp.]|nr:bifunctional (p)ppGpp synthetase/guanosine-3',5'-bis(diphosphate) 3'-pyrophosphohydrolase [Alistipes sp.]MBQ8775717.1 bifunctional (p)ppGpp synthetase/guanosine-3',5'-bis(diphosphate) 3'-pyrophosphohydrolase [Alistipes sp.]
MSVLQRYSALRDYVAKNFSTTTVDMVDHALGFADEHLKAYERYDHTPMLDHGVGVAQIVIEDIGLGRNSAIASIIHDVVRIAIQQSQPTDELYASIRSNYGEEVLGIVLALCKISDIKLKVSKEQASDFRDMIVSYSEDPRVILIKLADRLEVMRSLSIFPEAKRRTKSWESLNLYAQIAHKLGLYAIKSELEDLSLKYLEPEAYNHIVHELKESEEERMAFIEEFLKPVRELLDRDDLKYHIKSRTKSVYSIFQKMRKQKVSFKGVYDIFALRIIIDCPVEREKALCWTVYSHIASLYTPNPERMRDWISIPKSNGYESLHTTVSAGGGRWVEVQIRTERMDEVAERGIAAHWRYKGVKQGGMGAEEWLQRLREMLEDTTSESIAHRFSERPTTNEIFVFTPSGDIRKLPEGATVLDFAFDIHTSLGAICVGGKIGGRVVPIKEPLHNGDICEVLTRRDQTPKADWLTICVTQKARSRIRAFLREERQKHARLGREELERKLKNWKMDIAIDEAVAYLSKHFKVRRGIEVYTLIADQKVELSQIKDILNHWLSGEADEQRRQAAAEVEEHKARLREERSESTAQRTDALIIDERINNIEYKLGKCCNPIKGDDIFGFITISAGITIHRTDCPNARRMRERYPYRVMKARWREGTSGAFRVTVAISAADIPGLATTIMDIASKELKLSVRGINFTPKGDGSASVQLSVEVPSVGVVDMLLHSLRRVKGVKNAYRIN